MVDRHLQTYCESVTNKFHSVYHYVGTSISLCTCNWHNDSVSSVWALGFSVNEDNDPAPKNVPSPSETTDNGIHKDWNSIPWNERKLFGANDFLPTLTRADATLQYTFLGYFNHFLPVAYFKDTVLPATNACLNDPTRWEEFLRFIGLILLMATTQGNAARRDF